EDLARDDLVAFRDLVEDRRAEAGEGGAEGVELLADAFDAGRDPRRAAVIDNVGVDELEQRVLVPARLVALDEAPNDVVGFHPDRSFLVGCRPADDGAWNPAAAWADLPILPQVVLHRD